MASFRAIEQGFNLVRHTSQGLSAAFDFQGRQLASMDHYLTTDRVLVAQVPTRGTRTVYAFLGDWFAWACLAWAGRCGNLRNKISPITAFSYQARSVRVPLLPRISTVPLRSAHALKVREQNVIAVTGKAFFDEAHAPANQDVYEIRPRTDRDGFDLISDRLRRGPIWYAGPDAPRLAISLCTTPRMAVR